MPDMSTAEWMWVVGRIGLGSLFVLGAVHHYQEFGPIAQQMADRRVPLPRATLVVGSVFQAVCGLLLMAGAYATYAALGLVVFTIAASVMLLDFWNKSGPQRQSAIMTWQSNIAIVGGLLVAAAYAMRG
jgi:putative oxidoreductase